MILTNDPDTNIQLIKQLSKQCWGDNILLAQLTVAQAILESALNKSPPSQLALRYCNLFGMKPGFIQRGTGTPGIVYLNTKEWIQNKGMVTLQQPFLSNRRIEDSILQHKQLFTKLDRYQPLFDCKTFDELSDAILDAGYCTDPSYSDQLCNIYDEYDLQNL